ncbi:hypothetical protein MIT9_P0248 [Methylomarinovum caldicuralii]|uniref:Zinc finger/thioredoxin putative domain-containing protein n=1 Tax=Methylomarinovum caldicuralii TaxID=438856 RepID=A0AAU9C8B9_9GAMM|nr:zinc-ribbon and DUF3426 domain-containing protein [Methylomarinovum caldicuralii]BCX80674.1 hypothetical protein MIT9_P0248 [Methylomarinovum caldicuralii]
MYTRCPQCGTVYRIEARQLRQGRGEAICQRCGIIFGALESLGEHVEEALADHSGCLLELPELGAAEAVAVTPEPGPAQETTVEIPEETPVKESPLPETEDAAPTGGGHWYWPAAAAALGVLLLVQIFLVAKDRLTQMPQLRPVLETLCHGLGCRLPPFRNLNEIQVVDRALYPARERANAYDLYLVIVNQAPYPQPYPLLKLTLTALDGSPIATRIFKPEEYLKTRNPPLMPPYRMIFVELRLAAPKREVGGFQFELLS